MGSLEFLFFLFSIFSRFIAASSLSLQQPRQNYNFSSRPHFYGHRKIPRRQPDDQPVQLQIQENYVVLDNGILQVELSKPQGHVTAIQYGGIDNLLEVINDETDRGYWDIVWNGKGVTRKKGALDRLEGTSFKVIVQNEEQVEISFMRTWDPSLEEKLVIPLNIDKRYIMLRGSSGFYTYAIYERLKEWPAFELDNTRIAFKPRKDKFTYMAIADNRQRFMPLPDDRDPPRGQPLLYPEAVLLVDPIEPEFKGEVDDKYEYSCENKDIGVHGWISTGLPQPVGFWQITPSNEFRTGGPLKQSLTSHVGPTSLTILHSTHYSGKDAEILFGANEPWKKVMGPVFIYVNSLAMGGDYFSLWDDAKKQMATEVQSWPYNFPASEDFPSADKRGTVSGKFFVHDGKDVKPACGAYVGLALPGDAGSWQLESRGYQFWTRADESGAFTIKAVRPGEYNVYAWVPGFIGDFKSDAVINIIPGINIRMGDLVYKPPRNGTTMWEIGIPDRSAADFFVPDANPKYINKIYINHDKFRQYGLWERYTDLYPDGDLVFNIGTDNYAKDWFFAHVARKMSDGTYDGTTWQIKFDLDDADQGGTYTLRLALATANGADLEVRVNDPSANPALLATGIFGHDNTIARHGIHGLYRLFSVDVPGALLVKGSNTIFLALKSSSGPFVGLMYDYIRLEGPCSTPVKI